MLEWIQHQAQRFSILTEIPNLEDSLGISSKLESQRQDFMTPEGLVLYPIHTSDGSI